MKYQVNIFLILLLGIFFTTSSLAFGDNSICSIKKCPIIMSKNNNKVYVTCSPNGQCKITYQNKSGIKKIINNRFGVNYSAKFNWLSNDKLEIYEPVDQFVSNSLFIDFNKMQYSIVQNVFALNKNKWIVAYSMDVPTSVEISPIFNLSRKIIISENFSDGPASINVIMPDTHFDKNGNLVLVYDKGPSHTKTTEVILIDYQKLGI